MFTNAQRAVRCCFYLALLLTMMMMPNSLIPLAGKWTAVSRECGQLFRNENYYYFNVPVQRWLNYGAQWHIWLPFKRWKLFLPYPPWGLPGLCIIIVSGRSSLKCRTSRWLVLFIQKPEGGLKKHPINGLKKHKCSRNEILIVSPMPFRHNKVETGGKDKRNWVGGEEENGPVRNAFYMWLQPAMEFQLKATPPSLHESAPTANKWHG